jgi:hypothetical protein
MNSKKDSRLLIKNMLAAPALRFYGVVAITSLLATSVISSNASAQNVEPAQKTPYSMAINSGPDPVDATVTKENPTVRYQVSYSGHGALSSCNPDPGSYTHDKNSMHRWYLSTQAGLDPNADDGWTPDSDWHKCLKDSGTLEWPMTFSERDPRDIYLKADICAVTHDMFGTNPGMKCAHSRVLHVKNLMAAFINAAITKQPTDAFTSYKYNPCTFTSAGKGSAPLRIQWQRSKQGGAWEDIAGGTSPDLSVYWEPSSSAGVDGGSESEKIPLKSPWSYRVNYANDGGTVTSNTVTCTFTGSAGAW